MADRALAIKLLNDLCLECSIWAIFFNSSFTVSINARFRNRILSSTLINEFLMLFFTLVSNCIPFKNRFSNRAWPIYPLSAQSFPLISFRKFPCFNGSLSSTFAGENMKFRISPLSLITRCSLNPKNHPKEHLPRVARPSKVLWTSILWLRQTRSGVESTTLIPVHVPNKTCLTTPSTDRIFSSMPICRARILIPS